MFRRFRVTNFLSLKEVEVELEPLTIFAGPNSSGKSALFKALVALSKLLWYPIRGGAAPFQLEPGITFDEIVWNGDSGLPITFEVWFDDPQKGTPDYTLELKREYAGWSIARECFLFHGNSVDTGRQGFSFETSEQPPKNRVDWPGSYKAPLAFLTQRYLQDSKAGPYLQPIQDLRERLGQARRYRPSASDIASAVRTRATPEEPEVNESGRGLPAALESRLTTDRATFDKVQEDLHGIHEHVEEISFKRDYRGTGMVYKTSRAAGYMPASLESDGVLLSTFLLWRLHTATPNLKLCLEEPENGVPLWDLERRYELLLKFATERNLQVLIATHSRDFLRAVGRQNILQQVRIVEFNPSSGTHIFPLTHYREIDQLLQEFKYDMGDLWWSGRLRAPQQ